MSCEGTEQLLCKVIKRGCMLRAEASSNTDPITAPEERTWIPSGESVGRIVLASLLATRVARGIGGVGLYCRRPSHRARCISFSRTALLRLGGVFDSLPKETESFARRLERNEQQNREREGRGQEAGLTAPGSFWTSKGSWVWPQGLTASEWFSPWPPCISAFSPLPNRMGFAITLGNLYALHTVKPTCLSMACLVLGNPASVPPCLLLLCSSNSRLCHARAPATHHTRHLLPLPWCDLCFLSSVDNLPGNKAQLRSSLPWEIFWPERITPSLSSFLGAQLKASYLKLWFFWLDGKTKPFVNQCHT